MLEKLYQLKEFHGNKYWKNSWNNLLILFFCERRIVFQLTTHAFCLIYFLVACIHSTVYSSKSKNLITSFNMMWELIVSLKRIKRKGTEYLLISVGITVCKLCSRMNLSVMTNILDHVNLYMCFDTILSKLTWVKLENTKR